VEPKKILIFLLLILSIILVLSFYFPEQGVVISDKFKLNLHWSFSDLQQKEVKYADISDIIESNKPQLQQDTSLIKKNIVEKKVISKNEKIVDSVKLSNKNIYKIEYPSGDKDILVPFFRQIDKAQHKRVRIIHYGDSQIEGDRITGYLRNKFQCRFGGSGPGIMPAIPTRAESASIIHKSSKNWLTYSAYYKKDSVIRSREFGMVGRFSRYSNEKAWIEFRHSGMAYSSVNKFTQCKIFYGNYSKSGIVKGYVDGNLVWFEEPAATKQTRFIDWNFTKCPNKLRIEFEGEASPDIYGIALDADNGIAVDNISFRGSSGTDFSKMNYSQLKQMSGMLNVGLIIFEFGVNVVPYQTNSYAFYERALIRELNFLKKIYNAPILVVGVSDMSQHKGNHYESYPNIEKILEAQRLAAKKTNCAFWDLYHAMGGHNSMPEWVFANPPLARKDFTHFNRKGSYIIAKMLYDALMVEYNNK
jgi:lysophospholipase L1-like esterase